MRLMGKGRQKNCLESKKVQKVIMLEKLAWSKQECEFSVNYSAVILYMDALVHIICLSNLH